MGFYLKSAQYIVINVPMAPKTDWVNTGANLCPYVSTKWCKKEELKKEKVKTPFKSHPYHRRVTLDHSITFVFAFKERFSL